MAKHIDFLHAMGTNLSPVEELDLIEVGERVEIMLDEENNCWGPVGMLFWLTDGGPE